MKRNLLIETYFPEDEMTKYGFISHMESYIKQLLQNPLGAKPDEYLISHGIDGPKALSLLLKRENPKDEMSAVLIRTEKIRPGDLSEEDIKNGKTPKDRFIVKYKLPRKDYMKKMRNLFINNFENKINEEKANNFPELSKVTIGKKTKNEITFSFGKNGWGLSDELTKLGKKIEKLSQKYNIYIKDANFDTLDDVYDITFLLKPIKELNEGAWGYDILDNDSALDYQTKIADLIIKKIVKDIKRTEDTYAVYAKVGVLIDFMQKYKKDEVQLSDVYNEAIDFIKQVLKGILQDKEFIKSWDDPKELEKEIKKNYEDISELIYQRDIMPITEEGGDGATNASSSGQFVQPLFKKPISRTIYLTQEQVNKLQEEVVTNTPIGDFGYDAPPLKKKKDPAYNHNNIFKKSMTNEN